MFAFCILDKKSILKSDLHNSILPLIGSQSITTHRNRSNLILLPLPGPFVNTGHPISRPFFQVACHKIYNRVDGFGKTSFCSGTERKETTSATEIQLLKK